VKLSVKLIVQSLQTENEVRDLCKKLLAIEKSCLEIRVEAFMAGYKIKCQSEKLNFSKQKVATTPH